ncbi:MAG: VWA domain-containing protein [Planctomycetes bacterium]|nr:VWA domain-containing protein [Planctomycetota bacterium]
MTFINWIMLGGAAAFSIPLIIHLFNRSRFKVVQWGAMHLLESVIRVNKKRVKIEQLILLLIRCAIPALLALLMARPVLTGWRALSGDTPSSTVVLLDNSYSMQAGATSRTNWDVAIDESARVIERTKRGSDVSVVMMGGGPEPLFDKPAFDTRALLDQLRLQHAGYGAAEIESGVGAAAGILGGMSHAKRDLIVVSDFQKADWAGVDAPARKRLAELVKGMNVPATLTFMHVGSAEKDNVAVESLDFSRQTLGVGQTLTVRANLRNYGDKSYENLRVYFRADGKEEGASQIALAGGETAQALFTIKFDEPGSHVVEVQADAPDLKADNVYQAAISVLGQIPVLLVNGDPSKQPLAGETDFLEIALQPYAAADRRGEAKLADLIATTTVSYDQLKPESLKDQRVIVLANVPRLDDNMLAAIRTFVSAGGGVLIFPGNKIDVNWYNSVLADPNNGLLPMRLDALIGGKSEGAASNIVAQHYEHPALSMFNDRANGNLSDGEIRSWYKMSPSGAEQPLIIARLENGDPLFAEKKVGEGSVIEVATSADADWSNLPMRPFFLPLMQQTVTYLATSVEPPRNVEAGKPLIAFLPREKQNVTYSMVDPDGVKTSVKPIEKAGHVVVEFNNTHRPGLYTLSADNERPIHFVVNTSRRESQLEQLSNESLDAIAKDMNATVVHTSEEYAKIDGERRHGREIWKMMLLGLLGLLFGEMLLEQLFAKGRV